MGGISIIKSTILINHAFDFLKPVSEEYTWLKIINPLIAILFFSIASCTNSKRTSTTVLTKENKKIVEQRQFLKEYALCSCIRYGYKNTEVYEDVTVSLYNEAMLYSPYTLDTISMLAKKIAESVPPLQHFDYNKKKPILGGCIEFFKSKMLDSLIRRYDYQLKE